MEVEIIKANPVIPGDACVDRSSRKRVAAYCRVSTDDEDQIKSYNSMVRYYTDLIKSKKEWDMAGVYADKAITGTKVDKRENFQRLIDDCLDGKIDMVIAKSIPRFARNTLDTLKYVRMLKERNIDVYFEVEKIHSLKDGEFLLTILSSVAQQEVENTSAYVRKGLKMKMERGEMVGFQGCLGYDYDPVTKTLSINEEGAEDVKYIFDRYIAGAGGCMIARELNEMGKRTIKGNKWTVSSVMGIVKNEKYKGDLLMGKTYTVDAISKRRLQNMGQEDKYYIKNHHPAIVSEDIFDKAQEIRNKRNGNRYANDDIDTVMKIWLDTNIQAHDFISADYWKCNFDMVKEILPQAEIYVHEDDGTKQIDGFIGLNDTYIEGIFVKKAAQSKGIGKQLLGYAKEVKSTLRLSVYQKNEKAIQFYLREKFCSQAECVDENTGKKN